MDANLDGEAILHVLECDTEKEGADEAKKWLFAV